MLTKEQTMSQREEAFGMPKKNNQKKQKSQQGHQQQQQKFEQSHQQQQQKFNPEEKIRQQKAGVNPNLSGKEGSKQHFQQKQQNPNQPKQR